MDTEDSNREAMEQWMQLLRSEIENTVDLRNESWKPIRVGPCRRSQRHDKHNSISLYSVEQWSSFS